jgi:hypothetical protein
MVVLMDIAEKETLPLPFAPVVLVHTSCLQGQAMEAMM